MLITLDYYLIYSTESTRVCHQMSLLRANISVMSEGNVQNVSLGHKKRFRTEVIYLLIII